MVPREIKRGQILCRLLSSVDASLVSNPLSLRAASQLRLLLSV